VAENKLPSGVVYRPVLEDEIGAFPHVTRRFLPRPCMQCNNPPCVPVCPVHATWRRAEGVVVIDYDQCIGCRYCVTACPYGARTFDFGDSYTEGATAVAGPVLGAQEASEYEKVASHEYGSAWPRSEDEASPIGNVRKCHFCLHRLAQGQLPMCVTTCMGIANYFGDANDNGSLVAEMIANPNVIQLKSELGTDPNVYYLM
jgi:molybdopterin-containing oxidoreductase family iron-sulfur binding subunit